MLESIVMIAAADAAETAALEAVVIVTIAADNHTSSIHCDRSYDTGNKSLQYSFH